MPKIVLMFKSKWVLFLLIFQVLFLPSATSSLAATEDVNPKTLNKDIRTYTYIDRRGVAQLAAIDCSGVSGVPGIGALCGALDSGLDTLGTTIRGLVQGITNMPNVFTNLIKTKALELIYPIMKGSIDAANLILTGQPLPTTTTSVDREPSQAVVPAPVSLVLALYNNPPDLDTRGALSYILNNNILGVKDSLAQLDCSTWPANDVCPGRIRLNPVFLLWEGLRNIAYLAITLILIIFGFMVMLRSKIDPRTVITVQSVIPRLAIGLISIAFSYVIASLAVDIAQVSTSAVGLFFRPFWINPANPATVLDCKLTTDPCIPLPFFKSPLELQSGLGSAFSIKIKLTKDPLGIMSGLVSLITQFIIWYIFFQLFFALITNYAQIFVKTALGPVLLALGIIPSQSDALAKWFKGILANALVFPGIYFVLNFAVFINNFTTKVTLPGPLDQGTDIKGFLAIGLVVIASKVPAIIEEFLQVQSSGAVSRAGADVGQVARKIPMVGGFLG